MHDVMRMRRMRILALLPLILVAMAAFIALGGYGVMWLWNWLLPPLFGWHTLTFWQALGLLVLCRVLFGGLGLHGGARHGVRRRMAERWASMTPEEQERFRHAM